ncbi:hypothetical protein BDL97_12G042900 [Sphagnum fallax]|nr:hypothetical protein BDL97_12G042900 [Sphagnum fallax]
MPSRDEPHGYYDNNMASEEEEEKSTEDDSDVEEADDDDDDDDDGNSLLASTSHWPQSYKQSMDMYASPAAALSIFSPSLNRISNSFLSSSYQRITTIATGRSPDQYTQQIAVDTESLQVPFLPAAGKLEKGERPHPYKSPHEYGTTKADSAHEHVKLSKKISTDVDHNYDTTIETRKGSSGLQAMFNGMNILAGVGVLTTPYALKEGGWLGLVLLFLLSAISCYTGILLRRCLDSAPGLSTYPDIGQAAFGNTGRLIIAIILYTELYACCVEFLILEGDNLSALFPQVHGLKVAGVQISSTTLFAVVTAAFVLPTVWLRDLSLLSYVSAGGVIASLLVIISVFWVGAVDGIGFHHHGYLLNWSGIPVSIGLFGFCYSGHAVFPNIYTSLKNQADFDKILGVSFLLCTLLYGGVAVMGYTMFGEATASQITLNLPGQFLASKIAVWTTVVNPFTKYALTITPVAHSLEELLPQRPDSVEYQSCSILIRTALVLSTIVVAVLVPYFGLVMAFIGSFLTMTVSVILPCACYLSILGKKATISQVVLCSTMILVGVLCLIGGTYSSIAGIIESLYHGGGLITP